VKLTMLLDSGRRGSRTRDSESQVSCVGLARFLNECQPVRVIQLRLLYIAYIALPFTLQSYSYMCLGGISVSRVVVNV